MAVFCNGQPQRMVDHSGPYTLSKEPPVRAMRLTLWADLELTSFCIAVIQYMSSGRAATSFPCSKPPRIPIKGFFHSDGGFFLSDNDVKINIFLETNHGCH